MRMKAHVAFGRQMCPLDMFALLDGFQGTEYTACHEGQRRLRISVGGFSFGSGVHHFIPRARLWQQSKRVKALFLFSNSSITLSGDFFTFAFYTPTATFLCSIHEIPKARMGSCWTYGGVEIGVDHYCAHKLEMTVARVVRAGSQHKKIFNEYRSPRLMTNGCTNLSWLPLVLVSAM